MDWLYLAITLPVQSRIAKQPQTNSAIWLDGTVSPPQESKSKYGFSEAPSHSLPTMTKKHISHWKRLINFLWYNLKLCMSLLWSQLTKRVDVFLIHAGPKCQEVLSYHSFELAWGLPSKRKGFLLKETNRSVFFQYSILLAPTRNLPPLICRYWENLFSSGSFCNLRVKMYSYLFSKSSCISITCSLKVTTKALKVFFVRQNSEP